MVKDTHNNRICKNRKQNKLKNIFGKNMLDDNSFLEDFKGLLGINKNKPFECVGTYEEVKYAITRTISKLDKLPYLLNYYKENYELEDLNKSLETKYNDQNNLDDKFIEIVKNALK
mgnify:CR=1 FL=1